MKSMSIKLWVRVNDYINCYVPNKDGSLSDESVRLQIMSIDNEKREAVMSNGDICCLKDVSIVVWDDK